MGNMGLGATFSHMQARALLMTELYGHSNTTFSGCYGAGQ